MKTIVMYSSGSLFAERPTGGVRRFIELSTKFNESCKTELLLVGQDSTEEVEKHGFKRYIKLMSANNSGIRKFLPPEMQILVSNKKQIKQLKETSNDMLVVFDVPPAIGLVLSGFNNIVLMIRKDLIGYEKTINKKWSLYPKLFLLWFCESICMIKSKKIICQCNYDKNKLISRHPIIAKLISQKTRILINNVNPSWIVNNKTKGLEEIQIKAEGKFRVCFVGNFDSPRKGHQLLLDAANEILKKDTEIEFILIGGGKAMKQYKKKYENENIRFTGRLTNPNVILKNCDLSVVPSYADSCPNTVMEALYNGVPVIGSRAGGIPEILLDEEALFDLNINSLSKAITGFMKNPHKLSELKKRQKERCKELNFDWGDKMMELIME